MSEKYVTFTTSFTLGGANLTADVEAYVTVTDEEHGERTREVSLSAVRLHEADIVYDIPFKVIYGLEQEAIDWASRL